MSAGFAPRVHRPCSRSVRRETDVTLIDTVVSPAVPEETFPAESGSTDSEFAGPESTDSEPTDAESTDSGPAFADLPLGLPLQRRVAALGYTTPTPIQA